MKFEHKGMPCEMQVLDASWPAKERKITTPVGEFKTNPNMTMGEYQQILDQHFDLWVNQPFEDPSKSNKRRKI